MIGGFSLLWVVFHCLRVFFRCCGWILDGVGEMFDTRE
jgi:hypothetical protein